MQRSPKFMLIIFISLLTFIILTFIILGLMLGLTISGSFMMEKNEIGENKTNEDKINVLIYFEDSQLDTYSQIATAFSKPRRFADFEVQNITNITIKNIAIKPKHTYNVAPVVLVEVSKEQLDELRKIPGIFVEEDRPKFKIQLSEAVPFVGGDKIWQININNTNITGDSTICVIDTGVNASHPALAGQIIAQYDFCADNNNCTTNDSIAEDVNGHGTHVSGILVSQDNYSKGIAPGSKIAMAKAFNENGAAPTSSIISAIQWCIKNAPIYNISVISMSWGGGGPYNSSTANNCSNFDIGITSALENASSQNIILVAAAGNGNNTTGITYPACLPNVISVGAVGRNDSTPAGFSNSGDLLDIWAPGVDINSTWNNGGWEQLSGTSMATPFVSGAVTLLLHYNKLKYGTALNQTQILQKLQNSRYNATKGEWTRPVLWLVDSIVPINIIKPTNSTFGTKINFSIETDPNVISAIVSIDDSVNYTLTNASQTLWYNDSVPDLSNGTHNATFYIFSDINNSKTVYFTVSDEKPTINLIAPENNSNISPKTIINLSITDSNNISMVWYTLNNSNYTIYSNTTNYSINPINWTKGYYDIIVWANNTLGNINNLSLRFYINNSLPVWNWTNKSFIANEDFPIAIQANATDPDNESLNYSVVNLPAGAEINSSTGLFNWTPADPFVGNNTLTFRVNDPYDYRDENITIYVNNTNDPPNLLPIEDQSIYVGDELNLYIYATDDDLDSGDNLTFSDDTSLFDIEKKDQNSTHAKAKIEFTPSDKDVGTHTIQITVRDLAGESDSATFKLKILSSAGGGEGGGGISTAGSAYQKHWQILAESQTITWLIPDLPVFEIFFVQSATKQNASISIENASKPDSAPVLDIPYYYFTINTQNISPTLARIKFKIPKTWLTSNNISQVNLARWTGSNWDKLPTEKISENIDYVNYASVLSTFSTFVISGVALSNISNISSGNMSNISNITINENISSNISYTNATKYAQEKSKVAFTTKTFTIIFVLLVIVTIIIILVLLPKKKKKAKPVVVVKKYKKEPDFGF
ncbi:MAG: S8 family serine peptidase [Candidatus Nanoarchaeia archaeon]